MGGLLSSPIVETALSLVVVWFLLSLVVSAGTEAISKVMQFRGKYLWTSIDRLLQPPVDEDTGRAEGLGELNALPALESGSVFKKVVELIPGVPNNAAALRRVKRVNPGALVDAILTVQATEPTVFSETAVGKALGPLSQVQGVGLDQKRQAVERWVDDAMERMSAAYRAKMRWFAIGIAVVVVTLLGVDSVWSAQRFYSSSAARSATLTLGDEIVAAEDDGYAECVSDAYTSAVPIDSTTTTPEPATRDACDKEAIADLGRLGAQRYELGQRWVDEPQGFGSGVLMAVGLGVSAGAAAMGAPFWFDLLKRGMGARKQARSGSS